MVRGFLAIVSLGATKLSTWVAPAGVKSDPPTPEHHGKRLSGYCQSWCYKTEYMGCTGWSEE
jgi:hypothetical protein